MRLKAESSFSDHTEGAIETYGTLLPDLEIAKCLEQIRQGFKAGSEPFLAEEGTSGTYMLKGDTEDGPTVAVFKPIDEEPCAPNNPRGMAADFGSETCRPGIKSGESTLREVIAFLLDHDGFAGVPATALVEMTHPSMPNKAISES